MLVGGGGLLRGGKERSVTVCDEGSGAVVGVVEVCVRGRGCGRGGWGRGRGKGRG